MMKHFEIAKILFKAQMVYRFDVAFTAVFTVIKILFAVIVWGAVFTGKTTVAGFTFNSMLSYYVISSFLSQLDFSDGTGGEISGRIRGGSFSKYMVIPVSTFQYFLWQTIGAASFYSIFILLSSVIWVVVFRIDFTITSNVPAVLSSITLILLGMLFMVQLSYFIGILTFKYKSVWLFNTIKGTISAFVTGSLMPLILLPDNIVNVMKYFPFYYIVYLPAMMLLGRNHNEAFLGIVVLSLFVLAFIPINHFTYKSLRIKYDGVGI